MKPYEPDINSFYLAKRKKSSAFYFQRPLADDEKTSLIEKIKNQFSFKLIQLNCKH